MGLDDLLHPQGHVVIQRMEYMALCGFVEITNDPFHSNLQLLNMLCLPVLIGDDPQPMFDQMNDILDEREIWRIGWEGKDVKAIGVGEIFKCGLGDLGYVQ